MATTSLKINGIVRNKARDQFADGDCQEVINMRLRDGAWRVIGGKTKLYNALASTFDKVELHDQDNVRNFVGYIKSSGQLRLINPSTGSSALIKSYTANEDISIRYLKRFMLVIHSGGIDKFLYKDNAYSLVNMASVPVLTFKANTPAYVVTESATTAEALLGKYKKYLIELNQEHGTLEGAIMFRMAYKLFDGSYVLHSLPVFLKIADYSGGIYKVSGGYVIRFYMSNFYAEIDRAYYQTFSAMKDIISAVSVFACQNQRLYRVDEYSITDAVLEGITTSKQFSTFLSMNEDFKKMVDSPGWYKIKDIPFTQAIDVNVGLTEVLDTKRYYLDYMTRETLPVDNFSHHSLKSLRTFVYNDRLIMGDVTTIFGDHQHTLTSSWLIADYTLESVRESYLLYRLSTDQGVVNKLVSMTGPVYMTRNADGKLVAIFSDRILGYPDGRATEMKLITKNGDNFYITKEWILTKSAHDNYAYVHNPDFSPSQILSNDHNFGNIICEIVFDAAHIFYPSDYVDQQMRDANRVQVSELRNPYVFPAKNSYQVGTGEVIGLGANTEPLSTGQFGQYPLIVFTSKGNFALEQGQGGVVFSNVSPLSGEVATEPNQIISVGSGVIYTTSRGIYLVTGKQLTRISQAIEGSILTDFTGNTHFQKFVDTATLIQLQSKVSTLNVLEYVKNDSGSAIFGFDKINNELVITRADKGYSYVFSFESGTWHKKGEVYDLFVNDYPNLLAITNQGIFSLSAEVNVPGTEVLFVTQPQSLTLYEVYKKIERSVLRSTINVPAANYGTFAVFASDDLKTWQLITGGQRTGAIQNILCTRSHGSAKYYIFIFGSKLNFESLISGIDVTVVPRLERKLRT